MRAIVFEGEGRMSLTERPMPQIGRTDDVPAEIAALVEPLACVINGTNRAAVRPGESAVVFGAGPIGCLFTAVLRASGASPLVVVEPSAARAEVARAVGATTVVVPDELYG